MGRTFIHRLLNALFKRNKEDNDTSRAKDQAAIRGKAPNKAANARSKANLKEKHKAETEIETEEKFRSCALEIKNCIDLINSTGTPDKSKGDNGRAKVDNRKKGKNAGNRKVSGSRKSEKDMKKSKQGVSPAEMVQLLAKAEKNVSKAVEKAKEKEDKKGKRKVD
jgi:hypothetical protein